MLKNQCVAFHWEGQRCEQETGHPGNHSTAKSWPDIESATPGEFDL